MQGIIIVGGGGIISIDKGDDVGTPLYTRAPPHLTVFTFNNVGISRLNPTTTTTLMWQLEMSTHC